MTVPARRISAIDIFSGVGGLGLGFSQAGFDLRASFDWCAHAEASHHKNFPDKTFIRADLSRTSGRELARRALISPGDIDVVIGGPPCQGFSTGGVREPHDERNRLLVRFLTLSAYFEPRYILAENVVGLLESRFEPLLDKFEQTAWRFGYALVRPLPVLNAADYGVPQQRHRVFFLLHRRELPAPQVPSKCEVVPTVWDAIADLAIVGRKPHLVQDGAFIGELPPSKSEYASQLRCGRNTRITGFLPTAHTPATLARFSVTLPGTRDPVSRFFRLKKSGLAPTQRAGSTKARGGFTAPRPIHPVENRVVYLREAARLHGYPDWFEFARERAHSFLQLGNSVPPPLARAVASSIRSKL